MSNSGTNRSMRLADRCKQVIEVLDKILGSTKYLSDTRMPTTTRCFLWRADGFVKHSSFAATLLLGCIFAGLSFVAHATVVSLPVAISGHSGTSPGLGAGIEFELGGAGFGVPAISDAGNVAFGARLTGSGVFSSNNTGVWSGTPSGITPVMRTNTTLIPTQSVPFSSFTATTHLANLGDNGDILISGYNSGTGISGVFRYSEGGTNTHVARSGDPAPGITPANNLSFIDATNFWIGSSGNTGLKGYYVVGATTLPALFYQTTTGSDLQHVIGAGSTLPGGITIANSGSWTTSITPAMNDDGLFFYHAAIAGSGVNTSNDRILATSSAAGPTSIIARTGSHAPGMAADVNFFQLGSTKVSINNQGAVAFWGRTRNSGGTQSTAIWTGTNSLDLVPLARQGGFAPGIGGLGAQFSGFTGDTVMISATNEIAFKGSLTGTGVTSANNSGIWYGTPGFQRLLARTGNLPPGFAVDSGVVYTALLPNAYDMTSNSQGQLVFRGTVGGTGITTANDSALFALDPLGQNQLILREGQQLEVAPGEFRTVYDFQFAGSGANGSDGRRHALNDQGQFAYQVTLFDSANGLYSDGTFIADLGGATVSASLTIESGQTTTVPSGVTVASGGTFINNGIINGDVSANGLLGGNGTINGHVTVDANGTIAPGASPGTLTTGNTFWKSGGTFQFELNDASGVAGGAVGWDLQAIDGSLAIQSTVANPFVLDVVSLTASNTPGELDNFQADAQFQWKIATTTQGISGFSADKFMINVTGFTSLEELAAFTITSDGNNLFLNYGADMPGNGVIGDYNGDSKVDAADYTLFRDNLGSDGSALFNRDPAAAENLVGIADYNAWRSHFGQSAAAVASIGNQVPEPGTLLMAGLASVGACACARRRRAGSLLLG